MINDFFHFRFLKHYKKVKHDKCLIRKALKKDEIALKQYLL